MFESIIKAALSFCQEQLGIEDVSIVDSVEIPKGTLIAYIDIKLNGTKSFRVYVMAQKAFVQHVAKVFFDEDDSDEETIKDMLLECTNLIVGSAKVIASKEGFDFTITTPKFADSQEIQLSTQSVYLKSDIGDLFVSMEEK